MQFFPIPFFFITLGQMMWQGSNGGAVFIYLALNRTIRSGVLSLVCSRFTTYQGGISPTYISASARPETEGTKELQKY
uniref:Secreted protein n=1 Tax=Steinernema glaseri TaxID=37863 RepID=A0A1I7YA29_9BILA